MEFCSVSDDSLKRAADVLRSGGLVAFPTETVYGLGADAFNGEALAKVFEVKGRPRFDPLIIHIAALDTLEDVADLSLLTEETRKKLFLLAENLWPGPLSIVLPKNEQIPALATAGLSTAAVRFPSHETAIKLISLSGTAVAAPSANPFGSLSPTRAEHVRDALGDKIDMILDGGSTRIGLESTVLDITGETVKILRPGGTPKEAIESLIGQVFDDSFSALFPSDGLVSPGQLKSHYAPKTPISVFTKEEMLRLPCEEGAAFLFFDGQTRDAWIENNIINHEPTRTEEDFEVQVRGVRVVRGKNSCFFALSEAGSVREAAACLFETLHELDRGGFSRIFAQLAPPQGLGQAINDRLVRASAASSQS